MAKALECPACGARHRLDTLPDSRTFRCDRCGQVLKVPDSVASTRPSSPARGGSAAGAAAAAPAPPPRRRGAPVPAGPSVSATATATMPATAADLQPASPPSSRRRNGATPSARPAPSKVHWWWRVLAWFVAVPLGLLITGWPALQLDLLKKDDLLDVFVGEGTGRYVRLLVFAAVWALVTALLVQLFVDGGRWLVARRRARAAAAPVDAR